MTHQEFHKQLAGLCDKAETNYQTKMTLPLPVQDMVRHMRRSFGSSGNKSDVCPLAFRHDQANSPNAKSTLIPKIWAQRLASSSSDALVESTLNKRARPTNMDAISPNGNLDAISPNGNLDAISPNGNLNAVSLSVQFHDQTTWPGARISSTSLNSACEISALDDRIQRSSVTFVRANSCNINHHTTAEFSVAANLQHNDSESTKHLSSNPTLMELKMEQAISLSDVRISGDSECHNSSVNSICHAISEHSNTPNIISILSEAGCTASSLQQTLTLGETATASANVSQKHTTVAAHILENMGNFRTKFSNHASRPRVGIAAVMKSTVCPSQAQETKFHSPELFKLVQIMSPQSEPESDGFCSTKVDHKGKSVPWQNKVSFNQTVPSSSSLTKWAHVSTLQTKTPCPDTLAWEESIDEKWQKVKNFLGSPEYEPSVKRRKRTDSGSSGPISDDGGDDEDISSSFDDKDDDSDDDYSDIDADLTDIKPSECESLVALGKNQKQYFWQYNVQAKGPKGTRLKLAVESPTDPHVLNDFEDPVFDECNTAIAGIRHGGKARKGDGNEITPNPKKLFIIGHQLMRLNHQINACQLGTDVPLAKRNEARKEKNKLASRACRLKKKAQHEANKIKLYGLEQEHSQLNSVLQFILPHIHKKAISLLANTDKPSSPYAHLTHLLEAEISGNLKSMIAGHTVEYVNSVILKVESGDYNGGLNIKRSHKS